MNKPIPRIRIDCYEAPVHVGYKAVRELVPKLLDETEPDYVLHIGMASGRPFYSCERRGHRSGYYIQDVDGELLNDEYNRIKEGSKWIWHGCPEELLTSLPFNKLFRQWKEACPVRIESPGYYYKYFCYSFLHLLLSMTKCGHTGSRYTYIRRRR